MDTIYLFRSLDLSARNLREFNSNEFYNNNSGEKDESENKEELKEKTGYNNDIYEIVLSRNLLKTVSIKNFTTTKKIFLGRNILLEKIELENCTNLNTLDISHCPNLKEIVGLENHNIKLLICEGNTNINFLEEKFDINVMFAKDNEKINHIIDNLYLGDCSHSEDDLIKLGISYVFNMTPNDYRKYDNIIEIKTPIQDIMSQNIMDIYPDIVKKIKELNDDNLKIYIHCHAGISRSASLVILYVMKYHNMNFETAFKFVREKRLCIQPNPSFVEQLKFLEEL